MKIVHEETLVSRGPLAESGEWRKLRASLLESIRRVDWPPGSGAFTIYPESGKRRGEGNGVKPIKLGLLRELKAQGWKLEEPLELAVLAKPGDLDAVLATAHGPIALEWETGNISSSHRAINKMALGLLKGLLACGLLVVPSRKLYPYLTDRIGNYEELRPYLFLWKSIPYEAGVLEIIVVEHDATSLDVPKIPKGTSGRALG